MTLNLSFTASPVDSPTGLISRTADRQPRARHASLQGAEIADHRAHEHMVGEGSCLNDMYNLYACVLIRVSDPYDPRSSASDSAENRSALLNAWATIFASFTSEEICSLAMPWRRLDGSPAIC